MKKALIILFIIAALFSVLSLGIFAERRLFSDVAEDAWYAEFVADCADKGLMVGTSNTEFSPESAVTRAMFVQSLYKFYKNNIQGTDRDLTHLGSRQGYSGGWVETQTEVDAACPFTLEQVSKVLTDPSDPSTEKEITYKTTREELLSGNTADGIYASDIKKDKDNIISFGSRESLTLIPGSSDDPCMIRMQGGNCVKSGFSGYAEKVTVHTDEAKVEATTKSGSEFEVTLCDLGSRTAVIVRGRSSGELSAELYGYDLSVIGAIGEYSVEVYEWNWNISGNALKKYTCPASTEKSNAIPFGDVNDSAYYSEALKWAAMRKVVSGLSQTKFDPNAPITREQIATIINKFLITYYLDLHANVVKDCSFADEADISPYAKDSIKFAAGAGLMVGDDQNKFNPKRQTKRCEVAVVLADLDAFIFNR